MCETEITTATPPRKSSVSLKMKGTTSGDSHLLSLRPPPSTLLEVAPTPHPTPKISPSPPIADNQVQHLHPPPQPSVILSPSSSARRSRRGGAHGKPRHRAERLSSSSSSLTLAARLCIDDPLLDSSPPRAKKSKNGVVASASGGCASPLGQRSGRRVSRRIITTVATTGFEKERKEFGDVGGHEKDLSLKRSSRRHWQREKEMYKNEVVDHKLDSLGQWFHEMIMWKDVAKSSLWFGLGSLCFLATGFAKGISFSVVSVASQLALLFLAMAFFYDSFPRREKDDDHVSNEAQKNLVRQEDITYIVETVVPLLNVMISKSGVLFSGNPSTTLKVAPALFIASEYGHLLSLWRLFATGFFFSFTVPKMYSRYCSQLHKQAENLRSWILETWSGCCHKRILATSAATIFWNLSSMKMRFFAAFMFVVLLRFYRQTAESQSEAETRDSTVVESRDSTALCTVEERLEDRDGQQ